MRSGSVRAMLGLAMAAIILCGFPAESRAGLQVFVANYGSGTVERYSSSGTDLGTFASVGEPLRYLAFDKAGNLYVDSQTGIVYESSATGTSLGAVASVSGIANGLAFDSSGNLYVGNYSLSQVEKFSPTGVDLGTFASTGLDNPSGLAFDKAGNLYVANYANGTVEKFSPEAPISARSRRDWAGCKAWRSTRRATSMLSARPRTLSRSSPRLGRTWAPSPRPASPLRPTWLSTRQETSTSPISPGNRSVP